MRTQMRSMTFGVAIMLTTGCGKNDNKDHGSGGDDRFTLKPKLDLDFAAVTGFVVATGPVGTGLLNGSGTPVNTPTQVLYSIGNDGTLTEVTVTEDEEGQTNTTSRSIRPSGVNDTPNVVLFAYEGFESTAGPCGSVAVRKTDGALYCIGTQTRRFCPNDYSPVVVPVRGSNSLLVQSIDEGLIRLDFAASPPTETKVIDPDTDGWVCSLAVNAKDDFLVGLTDTQVQNKSVRVYKDQGGFKNISASEGSCIIPGPDSDPQAFFYVQNVSGQNVKYSLFRLAPNADGDYEQTTYVDDLASVKGDFACSEMVRAANKIFSVYAREDDNSPDEVGYFVELVNPEAQPKKYVVSDLKRVDKIYGYNDGLVLLGVDSAGNSAVKRFLFADNSFQNIVEPGSYVITHVAVAPTGAVTFGGRRASDNARILGSVAAGSAEVKIDATSLQGDVQALVRLN